MISEWLYWFTCQIGYGLNRGLGFEDSPQSNLLSGITAVWLMLMLIVLMLICVLILLKLETKKEK